MPFDTVRRYRVRRPHSLRPAVLWASMTTMCLVPLASGQDPGAAC